MLGSRLNYCGLVFFNVVGINYIIFVELLEKIGDFLVKWGLELNIDF